MRFSRQLPSQQLLFAAVFGVGLLVAEMAAAQDTVRQRNGSVRSGQITGVRNGNVMVKSGPAEIGVPLNQVESVVLATPTGATRGLQLQEQGKFAEALAALKPVSDQFGGLPIEWSQKAVASIGDLYLSLDKPTEAAAAYARFKQLYPEAGLSVQADVGIARVAFANNQIDEARSLLEPVVAGALQKPDVTKTESAAFGQAYYTLGQISEKEGKLPEALENYLRTVTIFYADRAIAARAQERADALRKNGSIAVP